MLSCGGCHIVRSPPLAKIGILRIPIKPATDSTLKPASWNAPEPATPRTIERHALATPYDRRERTKSARKRTYDAETAAMYTADYLFGIESD